MQWLEPLAAAPEHLLWPVDKVSFSPPPGLEAPWPLQERLFSQHLTEQDAADSRSEANGVEGSACSTADTDALQLGSSELPTRGSAAHHIGACKPCAFVYKDGCASGVDCSFCHLCPPGEKLRRKKEMKLQHSTRRQEMKLQHSTRRQEMKLQHSTRRQAAGATWKS
eukprot:TRINITY_DN2215_c0_g1_i1.p1 TRINITY_DN2215_c0_g1~~TRINITY_DN2215_c0_g1_i1.p1  ORF type:complete len:167 (+),score=39.01 TRINITY_DN2215_c0_g1_i1:95-595(+)